MATMPSVNITVTIPRDVMVQVEETRGDVPRSIWVKRAIEQRLQRESDDDLSLGAAVGPDMGQPVRGRHRNQNG